MKTIKLDQIGAKPRVPSRPQSLMQPEFLEKYDSEIFAYDVFTRYGETYFISPPNDDIAWKKAVCEIKLDGRAINEYNYKIYRDKIHKLVVKHETSVIESSKIRFVLNPLPENNNSYCRVLYTLQKNNSLEWIRDWISWHVEKHKVDTVVIYDNGSDRYDINYLRSNLAINDVSIIIRNCPFIYGPEEFKGSGWDSDYLQYAMFEHVRSYYCNRDSMLLNVDVDELVFSECSTSIFDIASNNKGVCTFGGKWLYVNKANEKSNSMVLHSDHTLIDINSRCSNKWVANLRYLDQAAFLRVHDARFCDVINIPEFSAHYLHFRNINTNWKYNRGGSVEYDNSKHQIFKLNISC